MPKDTPLQNLGGGFDDPTTGLVDKQAKDDAVRIAAIWVAVFTVWIDSIMFSIVLPSMAIYLQTFISSSDPSYATYLGLLAAAHPIGQLIGSPLAGLHFTKRGARESMLLFLTIFMFGCVFYATASSVAFLMVGRFIQGFGDANLAVCRAFVGKNSHPHEKMKYLSYVSAAQALGFTFGSLFGGTLSLVDFTVGSIVVNQYTAPGWFSFVLGFGNILGVYFRFKFTGSIHHNVMKDPPPPDRAAVIVSMFMFFLLISSFSILLTVTTPYLNIIYGWSVGNISIIYVCGSVIGFFAFSFIHLLENKYFTERQMLLLGFTMIMTADFCQGGFGWNEAPLWLWIIGTMIFFCGHPFAMASNLSLYSKICGPGFQGIYMGIITAVGSLGSILSPLWGTAILDLENFHGKYTFCSTGLLLGLGLCSALLYYDRLRPHPLEKRAMWGEENNAQGNHTDLDDSGSGSSMDLY